MQLEAVLSPEETQALGRLVSTDDARRAIEAKYQVVSLSKIINDGGRTKVGLDHASLEYNVMREEVIYGRWDETYGSPRRGVKPATSYVPRLAIAPSRAQIVTFRATGTRLLFSTGKWELSVPSRWGSQQSESFTATAPIIPAEARAVVEQNKFSLVLWEADWKPVPVPLGDPAILIPLIGDLYAVGAVWDLTDLEKKVLQKAFV